MSNSKRLQEYRRLRNNPQSAPPTLNELLYPEGVKQADVLFVVGNPPAPGWWETRGRLSTDLLEECGIPSACVTLPSEGRLRALIEELRPKVIVNRAMLVSAETTARLAAEYPHIKFLAMNQSSHSFLIASLKSFSSYWGDYWKLAETQKNCYLVSPDERNFPAQIRPDLEHKILWAPNPSRIPEWQTRKRGNPPLISLIMAGRPLKNIPNQLLGYALARKQMEMGLLVSCRGYERPIRQMLESLQVQAEIVPWLEWADYIERLHTIDVGLQVSFTESFNYVALEHMLCGSPVVGSDAIRYIPKKWRADVDSPQRIASKILERVDGWEEQSLEARKVSTQFANERNRQFQYCFEQICGD